MSKRTLMLALAALLLIVAVVATIVLFTRDSGSSTVTVERGSIDVMIQTYGRLQPGEPVVVRTPIEGEIDLVAVESGQQVDAGDVIAQFSREPIEETITQAVNQRDLAELQLAVIEEREPAESASEVAERAIAEQRVREAQALVEEAEMVLQQSLVLAPVSGTVLTVSVIEDSRVSAGSEFATIANLNQMELQVDLDEIDIPLVRTGAEVSITTEAYPDTTLEGIVQHIAPQAQPVSGTTVFPATIEFSYSPELQLRPGMNADVQIQTDVRSGVLLIPEETVVSVGRRTFVDVEEGGDVERREVRLGLRSDGMVEVADGLEEGDEIVIN